MFLLKGLYFWKDKRYLLQDYYNKTKGNLRDFHLNQDVFYDNREYSMDLYNNRILEIIANHDQNDPLFLYAAMQTPHSPYQVPQVKILEFE